VYRFVLPAGLFTHSSHSSNLDMSDDDEDAHSPLLSFVPLTPPRLVHKHRPACPSLRVLQAAPCTAAAMVCRTTSMSRRAPPPPLQLVGLHRQSGILTWTPNTIPTADPFPDPALAPANVPDLMPHAACNELEESGPRYQASRWLVVSRGTLDARNANTSGDRSVSVQSFSY
jgi:hypothetical protein